VRARLLPSIRACLSGRRPERAYLLGVMNGLLPCPVLAPLVLAAAASGAAAVGSLLFICLGLGTLPAMLLVGQAGPVLRQFGARRAKTTLWGGRLTGPRCWCWAWLRWPDRSWKLVSGMRTGSSGELRQLRLLAIALPAVFLAAIGFMAQLVLPPFMPPFAIAVSTDTPRVLDAVAGQAVSLLGAATAQVCLIDANRQVLRPCALPPSGELPCGLGASRDLEVQAADKVLSAQHTVDLSGCPGFCPLLERGITRTHLAAPVRGQDELLGAICVGSSQVAAWGSEARRCSRTWPT
jgi:hypothetical protein